MAMYPGKNTHNKGSRKQSDNPETHYMACTKGIFVIIWGGMGVAIVPKVPKSDSLCSLFESFYSVSYTCVIVVKFHVHVSFVLWFVRKTFSHCV